MSVAAKTRGKPLHTPNTKKVSMPKFIATLLATVILTGFVLASPAEARKKRSDSSLTSTSQSSTVRVRNYTRRSTGSYVFSHRRTSGDRTKFNNWSTKGNVNPYTGKRGTKSVWAVSRGSMVLRDCRLRLRAGHRASGVGSGVHVVSTRDASLYAQRTRPIPDDAQMRFVQFCPYLEHIASVVRRFPAHPGALMQPARDRLKS